MHHCHTMCVKPGIAALIALRSSAHVMADAVDLDRERSFSAIEIKYIRANGMLTAENRLPQ